MIKEIKSKDNAIVKFACSLKLKKNREEQNLFLCEGIKNLKMALSAGIVESVFTSKGIDFEVDKNVTIYIVTDDIISKISDEKNPEGIVGICHKISWQKNTENFHRIVYLDEIRDPGNMGTIIRTALALKYDAVILSENCVDIYNEKVIAASKGALYFIPVFKMSLTDLTSKTIYVSTLGLDSINLNNIQKTTDFVLVLGNESHGVSENSLSLANYKVKIDISDKIDSLNVAVAAGILMNSLI